MENEKRTTTLQCPECGQSSGFIRKQPNNWDNEDVYECSNCGTEIYISVAVS